ncbi:MAG: FecR domain-containing protein [Pseudobdellovibrionaceae bacterium]
MSGLGRTEKIILACAMTVLMVFSYFLYDDSFLFQKPNNNKLELIGNVSLSQNDVRRKNLDTFSWLPASEKDKVFQNDSIFTGDRSEALIRLQDGTQIKIQPNSLITLNLKNGQMNLNLRYGNLVSEIAQNSSLTITSGTEEFKLENKSDSHEKSKIQFKKNHSARTDLKLLSGNVKYINKKKNSLEELKKNEEVAVSKSGNVKKIEKPVLTLSTENNFNSLRTTPEESIPFNWKGSADVSRYELEISDKEDFSSITLTKSTSENQLLINDPLKAGSYFWRLKAYDKDGELATTSSIRNFKVANLEGPQIVSPIKEAQLNFELKVKNNEDLVLPTEIKWTSTPELKNFTWQISQQSDFATLLQEGQTKNLSAIIPKLASGTYWVRVQGQTETQKKSPWSEMVSFKLNLVARKEVPPPPPILISKNIEFKIPSDMQDRKPSSIEAPQLAWKPVLAVKKYQLQISKDSQFSEPEKYDVTQNQLAWSKYHPGKYFYRVYAQGLNGLVSAPSETGILNVSAGSLVLSPFKSIDITASKPSPKDIAVTWTPVPFAKHYLVQMDQNKNFSQPAEFEFTTHNGSLTLPNPGRYAVRVRAFDETKTPITEFSNTEEVLFTFKTPLGIPLLSEPFNKASIFLQSEMEPFIWLEWKAVERATSYNLEISDKPDFSRLLISKSVTTNRYLIKDKIPLGKIYWRIQAIAKKSAEISQWTDGREFTLHHQKKESFVK